MSFEVNEQTLASLCLLVVDCPHSTPVWTDAGVVVLRNQNIKNGRLDLSAPSYTDEAHYLGRIKRAAPTAGDLVITREAPMGEVCQIPSGLRSCLGQRQVLLRPDPSKVDGRFLLFALQSPYLQRQIGWNEGTGSTVSNLRIPVLESLKVPTPPLQMQRDIAITLGALDDRIALLHETNATLEAIAQALFKSWFVDFDPVRAKVEGRKPEGLSEEVTGLFPDRFEESGEMPLGWTYVPFNTTIKVIGGGTPKTSISEYWGGEMPWFSVVDAPASSDVFVLDTEKHVTKLGIENSSTKILPEGTTIISARGTVGRLALVGCEMAMNQSCYGLRGIAGDAYFTYFSTHRLVETLKQRSHGSVFDTITTQTLAGVSLVYPPSEIIDAFEALVGPCMTRIKENVRTVGTLSLLRDALLPKLISRQIRLPEAEAVLRDAA